MKPSKHFPSLEVEDKFNEHYSVSHSNLEKLIFVCFVFYNFHKYIIKFRRFYFF